MTRLAALVAALALAAVPGLAAEPLRISAVNAPLAHFAARLAGDAAEVVVPVPEGVDPEHWRPDIAAVSAMQQADLILLNGADIYGWVQRVSLPRARVVDTVRGFAGELIEVEGVTHSHGDEPEHTHGATAANTWLDFRLAARQAEAVAAALTRLLPAEADAVAGRLAELQAELAALDAEAGRAGARLEGEAIVAYHAGYEYLARYGLDVEAVSWDREAAPDAAALAELDALLAGRPARLMLVAAPPAPETAAALEARGLAPVVFDTAASVPPRDVLTTLASGIAALTAEAAKAP